MFQSGDVSVWPPPGRCRLPGVPPGPARPLLLLPQQPGLSRALPLLLGLGLVCRPGVRWGVARLLSFKQEISWDI